MDPNVSTWGWVTVTAAGSTISVRRDGEDEPLTVEPILLVPRADLVVGDRCWCQFYQRRIILLGKARG